MATIRRAEAQDATTISRLIGALLKELRGTTSASRPAPGPELAARLLAMSDRIFGFLAFDGERPVGVITELSIVPDRRSGGLAQELVKAATGLGGRLGWSRLEAGAPRQPEWQRSYDFSLKSGFTEIGPRLRLVLRPSAGGG
jgi:N-acetylglutamate synthase-like GNAT family acetyltransferase